MCVFLTCSVESMKYFDREKERELGDEISLVGYNSYNLYSSSIKRKRGRQR